MKRSAADRASDAAAALLAWLDTQRHARRRPGSPDPAGSAPPDVAVRASLADGLHDGIGRAGPRSAVPVSDPAEDQEPEATGVLMPFHTDWLRHRLCIAGPLQDLATFRTAAAGAGVIPWRLDLDRLEEDWFHLLVSPPSPQQRSLSLVGARVLAGQLREAVAQRHALAVSRVERSQACPFDLHALVPVPDDMLRLGPDHPDALGWLWQHWGTTQMLRHVAVERDIDDPRRHPAQPGLAEMWLGFWSADWTPWRALAIIATGWPTLRFDATPIYEAG